MKELVPKSSFLAAILMASLLLVTIAGARAVYAQDKSAADTNMQILRDKVKADKKLVVAANMELLNAIADFESTGPQGRAVVQEALAALVATLAPITPHICHALWQALGHAEPVIDARWPEPDPAALKADMVTLVVQVNGKLRGRVEVPADAGQDAIAEAALGDENVRKFIAGAPIRKRVVVPGKLVNFVV